MEIIIDFPLGNLKLIRMHLNDWIVGIPDAKKDCMEKISDCRKFGIDSVFRVPICQTQVFTYLSRLFRLICADQENQIHDKWDEALFEVLFAALASTFMFLLTGERCGSAEYCTPAWKVGSCLDTETPSG